MNSFEYAGERRDMTQQFDAYLVRTTNSDGTIGKLTLRQSETFLKIRNFIAGEDTHGLLELACGYGKSALETMACQAIGAGTERADGQTRQVLLSTSRLSILQQFVGGNVHYDDDDKRTLLSDFEYFAPGIAPSVYTGQVKDLSGDAVVMPYASLTNILRQQPEQAQHFSAYLLDECHNLGSGRVRDLKRSAPDVLKIGLSGTPGNSRDYLSTMLDKVPMVDGILKYGFLSGLQMHGVPTGYAFYPGYTGPDYSSRDTEGLAEVEERNQKIVDTAYANVRKFGPGVIKCHRQSGNSFSHMSTITNMLNDRPPLVTRNGKTRPLHAEAVAGSIPWSHDIMHEFLHGDSIDILAFVDIITEGVNLPTMSWGLWTPPVKKLRQLEQFTGRGTRKDPRNRKKIFHFFQLVDIDLRDHKANAFGWEIFDLPRNTKEATLRKGKGIARTQHEDSAFEPTIKCVGQDIHFVESVVLDSTEAATPKEAVTLSNLVEHAGKSRQWLKRLLAHKGFTAFVRLVDDEPDMIYDKSAEHFIETEVADDTNIVISRAARAFNVEINTMRGILNRCGIAPDYLYAPIETQIVKYQHVSVDSLQRAWDIRNKDVIPVQPSEILLADVMDRTGKAWRGSLKTNFFRERGFTVRERRVEPVSHPVIIVLKSEILPWLKAFQNALPIPANKKDYKSLASYSNHVFAEGEVQRTDVFTALRNLGIEPTIFKHDAGQRFEYILRQQEPRVTAEIGRVITNRLRQGNTAPTRPPHIKTTYSPPQLKIPELLDSDYANTGNYKNPEPADDIDQGTSKRRALPSGNILRALAIAHPSLTVDMLDEGDQPLSHAKNMFEAIVSRNKELHQEGIPSSWTVVADLAAQINMDERQLLRFFVEKKINSSHLRYIELNTPRKIIGLCSPELGQFILAKFHDRPKS